LSFFANGNLFHSQENRGSQTDISHWTKTKMIVLLKLMIKKWIQIKQE